MTAVREREPATSQRLVRELQGWHHAIDEASRYNRNLLQYAAGIAACLGIVAGSGSVFALADSLSNSGQHLTGWAWALLIGEVVVAGLFVLVLSGFLCLTFNRRGRAEREADERQTMLISLAPDRFWPKGE